MLASGRPVIATCHAGTELHAVVSTCGIVVEPEDTSALAEAICRLADDAALRTELGESARAYAEANFERDAVLERVFGRIESGEIGIPDEFRPTGVPGS
jgi:colanic acid biosynthesis glycosyl transferase WcaI